MVIDELKKPIFEYLGMEATIFSRDEVDNLTYMILYIFKEIERMIRGEKPVRNKELEQNIKGYMVVLSKAVLHAPLDNNLCLFINSFSELVFNWNNNTLDDDTVAVLSLFMSRIIESRMEMTNATTLIKEVSNRLKDLSNWSPPAFDISKTYFDKLLQEQNINEN